ncbi:MAG: 2-C-methyl-D-erythritol 4-phosphate cytidylyltransferase [Dehalococcoidia bacterium]
MPKVAAIVVSAGAGQRMGSDKTFLMLGDKPLIAWTVDVLQRSKSVDRIVLVLQQGKLNEGKKMATARGWSKISSICAGGELRQDSVKKGLALVDGCDWVLVQDGARPFLTEKLIADGLHAAVQTGAAAAAVEVKDTIKQFDEAGMVLQTLQRDGLRAVQTPQVFRTAILKMAYDTVECTVTDDAAIVELAGYRVKLYPGEYENIKVTTPEDLLLAEMIAGKRIKS